MVFVRVVVVLNVGMNPIKEITVKIAVMILVFWKLQDVKVAISVSRGHVNQRSRRRAFDVGAMYLFLFYYNFKNQFKKRRINKIQALYYRKRLYRKMLSSCTVCKVPFSFYYPKSKIFIEYTCSKCENRHV